MDILRTIPVFYPEVNGPANQAYHISRGLLQEGIRSRIFTTNHKATAAPQKEVMDGFVVTRFKESFGFMAYRRTIGIRRLYSETADIIHAHSYRNAMTDAAFRMARRKRLPFVLQPHGQLLMFRHTLNGLRRLPYRVYDLLTQRKQALQANAVVVATQQEKTEAIEFGVSEERLHVIPVGAATIDVQSRPPADISNGLQILFVGRISPDRNLEQVLHGVAKFRARTSTDVWLRIVGPVRLRSMTHSGDAYIRRVRSLITHLQLDNSVEFCGEHYGPELSEFYRKADLFVYTSNYENFGQTVLEAAAHGCPIISTPTGVARDIVRDGKTGFLVPHGDSEALSERLREVFENPAKLASYGQAIHQLVSRNYQWEAIIHQYRQLYQSL